MSSDRFDGGGGAGPSVDDYYDGKTLFLTGCTGFLGKALLEKYLRELPQVRRIYILIRPKAGQDVQQRLEHLQKSTIFEFLRKRLGQDALAQLFHDKVEAIPGDILEPFFGISDVNLERMFAEVDIIVHNAATIRFSEPLINAVEQNVQGPMRMLEIAKRCRNLKLYVHVSTAYTGCNQKGRIYERLHEIDYDAEQMLEHCLSAPSEQLIAETPKIIGDHPNTYTFTKLMAEHLLVRRREHVPILFLRPAIVGSTWRDPQPGWLDAVSAASAVYLVAGLGVINFLHGSVWNIGDQIPVDIVTNATIAGPVAVAKKPEFEYEFIHIGTSAKNPVRWILCKKVMLPYLRANQSKRAQGPVWFEFIPNKFVYNMLYALQYKVPISLFRWYANAIGTTSQRKKAQKLTKLERQLSTLAKSFNYFIYNEWIYDTTNYERELSFMTPEEQERFPVDVTLIDWHTYLPQFCWGIKRYILKEEALEPHEDRNVPLYLEGAGPIPDVLWAANTYRKVSITRPRSAEETKQLVLSSEAVLMEIQTEARETGKDVHVIQKRAREIMNTMGGDFNLPLLRSLGWMFRKIYRHLYEHVIVDLPGIHRLREIMSSHHVALLPNHRSYIDFLLMSYLMFAYYMPVPHIAAGDDFLNMVMVGWMLRNAGAFFIRRTLGNDKLYRVIFKEYVRRLLLDGYPLEFFVEGTRSRTGKNLSPKMGLLGMVTEVFFEHEIRDLYLCPVSINYEKYLEEDSHVGELLGSDKVKPSLTALLKSTYTKLMGLNLGTINVQFGEPVSLSDYVHDYTNSQRQLPASPDFDPFTRTKDRPRVNRALAYKLVYTFNQESVCMCTAMVASILLTHRLDSGGAGISRVELLRRYVWLKGQIERRGHKAGFRQGETPEQEVNHTLNLIKHLVRARKDIIEVKTEGRRESKNIMSLALYRNQVPHMFVADGCVLLAFYALAPVPSFQVGGETTAEREIDDEKFASADRSQVLEQARFVWRLLRREFHVHEDPDFEPDLEPVVERLISEEILTQFVPHNGDTASRRLRIAPTAEAEGSVAFLRGLFAPFIDSYWVVCSSLLSLHEAIPQRSLVDRLQWVAENMFYENQIFHFESCSKETLNNAIEVFAELSVCHITRVRGDASKTTVEVSEQFSKGTVLQELADQVALFRHYPPNVPHHQRVPLVFSRLARL